MGQHTLSMVLEVEPASVGLLSERIEELKALEDVYDPVTQDRFANIKRTVPSLHFLSISIFHDTHYDPIFVIEANFDGQPGPFWAQLEAAHGEAVRAMLRCCKRPGDRHGPLFTAVTRPQSRCPIAPYLEARTILPSVFHHGNRGLDRERILAEGKLFMASRKALAQPLPTAPNPYRAMTAVSVHRHLRAALVPAFPWLNGPAQARIGLVERAADGLRLLLFAGVVLLALSLPGLAFWPITPLPRFLTMFALGSVLIAIGLYGMRAPLTGKGAPTRRGGLTFSSLSTRTDTLSPGSVIGLAFWVAIFLAIYLTAVSLLGAAPLALVTGHAYGDLVGPTFWAAFSSLASVVFCALAIVLWLRFLERRDPSQDAPPLDERMLREMTHREDRIAQNHMGSVVLVKPGVLRMALFRVGHLGLHLVLRVVATDGYLGSMRTVHFAHWAFVNNGSRLMFLSNFDRSWDSYLDDFIEKAHGGLTLAWGSGVGFPATRFLVLDGASHGRQFKAWARQSMAVSRFWFSAYEDYTVDQVERQFRIAEGLRRTSLTPREAAAWARDL